MRRRWQGGRLTLLFLCVIGCAGLMALSSTGLLAPVEGLAATPLNFLSGIFNRVGLAVSGSVEELTELEDLRQRNAELEETLSQLQAEVVELREKGSDYNRLAALLNYLSAIDNIESVTAEVINRDTQSALRTIVVNRGTRDGIRRGMAVITQDGLVGRITDVAASYSRVLLITSNSSAVSARLQTTRVEGTVLGNSAASLRMEMLPLDADVQTGDLVLTSGLGGNLPPDLVIGQVTSTTQLEANAEQEATLRSLIDFDRLEIVSIITSFEPVDLSIFETDDTVQP